MRRGYPPSAATEQAVDPAARPPEHRRVGLEKVAAVRAQQHRVELEGQLGGVGVRVELAGVAGLADERLDQLDPPALEAHELLPHASRAGVELRRGRGEEAAAGEDLALEVVEEGVGERD